MKLKLEYNNFLDVINLNFKVYNPLKEFVSKRNFISIVKKKRLTNNKFFPIPIFINISQNLYDKLKTYKNIQAYYKSKKVCDLKIKSFYTLNKIRVGESLFKTKNKKHPGLTRFLNSGDYFIQCKIENFNHKIMKNLNFTYPSKIKSIFLKRRLKTVVGFHTRNVPHRAHEWIHQYGLKKCNGLFIHPLIGQFKKKEYKEKAIIKGNLKLIKSIYKNKNVIFGLLNSYPRYAGPREALFHALIRKNYGCTHFMLGRDHAGVGKYYTKYESQKLCIKHEKYLKVKIISFKEPYLCTSCKKVVNKCNHKKNNKVLINGTEIRNLIFSGKKIPDELMRKQISKTLSKNSII
tara:strand:- start:303 stop:1346 length:1044 start_codon:yes stop_codon:yes gene_type:complete